MTFSERLRNWLGNLIPATSRQPKLDGEARDALLAELAGSRQANRWLAADALGEGDPGAKGVAALAAALSDPDPILSWEASRALAQIGTPAARRALLDALNTGGPQEKAAAAAALAALPADRDLEPALVAALDNPEAVVRQSAAAALVAHPSDQALGKLLLLVETDQDLLVRRAAALALGALGHPAAEEVLMARRDDRRESPLVREAAASALTRLRPPTPPESKADEPSPDQQKDGDEAGEEEVRA